MTRIIVDLDVVTVAKGDNSKNGDLSRKFLIRIEKEEFTMITPYILLGLVSNWKHAPLSSEIKKFYEFYSDEIISVKKLDEKFREYKTNRKELADELTKHTIKEEDMILVIITSLFDVDFLVTFNRKHLKNKEEEINNVLHKYKLKKICIVLPNEI